MTYNLSSIMSEAWAIARRFKGNGETLRALLARALKSVWYRAKVEVQRARQAAQRALAAAVQVGAMTFEALAEWAFVIECKDRLTSADYDQLDQIRREMARREN
ncbi:hypothetical protein [Paracoccus aminophilus]|uniref:Uncharacterized protein n=1 Tax=Paracoccus aminophilus JCM 7686 TaxID=1367847 RepID=S5Y9U3_PARAH|nr:hypothetical protein [Paracoccus aminophilus]AGT08128.1 hypothetical protein JCM7686_1019 [Paracoccus aminophilus JCM 7686]